MITGPQENEVLRLIANTGTQVVGIATCLVVAAKFFEGGSRRFLYKGTNGRWRDEIPPDELALYEQKATSRFTPGLASWIEGGRLEAGGPRSAPD